MTRFIPWQFPDEFQIPWQFPDEFQIPWQFPDEFQIPWQFPDEFQIPWHFQVFQTSGHPVGLGASESLIVACRQRIHGDRQPVAGYGYMTFIDWSDDLFNVIQYLDGQLQALR